MTLGDLIKQNAKNLKITFHALERMQENRLSIHDVAEELKLNLRIIEEYPDDPRGASALVIIFIDECPYHLVVAPHEEELIIITCYKPAEEIWNENYTRRRERK